MKNQRIFLKCNLCGNIVGLIEDGGGQLSCCGEEMSPLEPNTTDGAVEKHVPVAVREGGKLVVTVGEAAHPMVEEHYIGWIAVAQGDATQRRSLAPGGEPTADFLVDDGPVTVYAHCNLHGLWAAEA